MALTRRTSRFRELAEATERACAERGRPMPRELIDAALNVRVTHFAQTMLVEPDTALHYLGDDTPDRLARTVLEHVDQIALGNVIDLDSHRS